MGRNDGKSGHTPASAAVLAMVWALVARAASGGFRAVHIGLRQPMRRANAIIAALVLGFALAGCATAPGDGPHDPNDPFEAMNRRIFEASLATDRYVTLPAARAYRAVVPKGVRTSVRNFLNNLDAPVIFTNDILQGELERAGVTLARFGINTTAGLAGFVDVADHLGLPRHSEDFGQTLAIYGIGEGPYLFLPFVGPANPRDLVGWGVDLLFDPLTFVHWGDKWPVPYIRGAIDQVDLRERNIETLDDIQRTSIDFYGSVKSLYRQTRNNEIENGETQVEDLPDF
jgi:phospholipid-binding lipoprotein MlaA